VQKAKVNHPHIEANEKICGGFPVIKGTRTRVVDIAVEYEYLNHTPDEIINAHPYLKLEQIHDALSYLLREQKGTGRKDKKRQTIHPEAFQDLRGVHQQKPLLKYKKYKTESYFYEQKPTPAHNHKYATANPSSPRPHCLLKRPSQTSF
jgi:uncharacterized protein (DUF433 family)